MVYVSKIDEFLSMWNVAALSKAGGPVVLVEDSVAVDIARLCRLVLRVLVEGLLPQPDREALVADSAVDFEAALIAEVGVLEAASEAVIEAGEEVLATKGVAALVVEEVGMEVAPMVMVHPLPTLLLALEATEEVMVVPLSMEV